MTALEEVHRAKIAAQKAARLIIDVKHDLHMLEQRVAKDHVDTREAARIAEEVTQVKLILSDIQVALCKDVP